MDIQERCPGAAYQVQPNGGYHYQYHGYSTYQGYGGHPHHGGYPNYLATAAQQHQSGWPTAANYHGNHRPHPGGDNWHNNNGNGLQYHQNPGLNYGYIKPYWYLKNLDTE